MVVDMQNDFCAEGGFLQREKNYSVDFTAGVAERIARVLKTARAAGVTVVWIRSAYDFKYLTPAHQAKRGTEGCCLEGTWGAEFYRLSPENGEPVFTKHDFSAFTNPDLDPWLRDHGVETVVGVGVATNVCVDTTLRDAFGHGYHVAILDDCVGSNNQAGHDGTLATLRTNFGVVADSADFVRELTREAAEHPA